MTKAHKIAILLYPVKNKQEEKAHKNRPFPVRETDDTKLKEPQNEILVSNILKRTNFVSPYSYDFNKLHKPFDLNGPLQCSNI